MNLQNNEIILKEILPKKGFFFNMTEKIRAVFFLIFLVLSTMFLINTIASILFFFVVIVVGIVFFTTFFKWILTYFKVKNNYYLITNERIIVAKQSTKEIIKEKKLSEIKQVHIEMNNKFFGNIIFGEPEAAFGENNPRFIVSKRMKMNFKPDEYAFLSVDNISEIIPIFENLKLKVNKTFY